MGRMDNHVSEDKTMKKDNLRIRLHGEVSDLVLEFGWSCGDANPGIGLEIETHKSKHTFFHSRGGVMNKEHVKKVIKYLEKYISKCKTRK